MNKKRTFLSTILMLVLAIVVLISSYGVTVFVDHLLEKNTAQEMTPIAKNDAENTLLRMDGGNVLFYPWTFIKTQKPNEEVKEKYDTTLTDAVYEQIAQKLMSKMLEQVNEPENPEITAELFYERVLDGSNLENWKKMFRCYLNETSDGVYCVLDERLTLDKQKQFDVRVSLYFHMDSQAGELLVQTFVCTPVFTGGQPSEAEVLEAKNLSNTAKNLDYATKEILNTMDDFKIGYNTYGGEIKEMLSILESSRVDGILFNDNGCVYTLRDSSKILGKELVLVVHYAYETKQFSGFEISW